MKMMLVRCVSFVFAVIFSLNLALTSAKAEANPGAIAAGVVVPVVVGAGLGIAYFIVKYKKAQQNDNANSERPDENKNLLSNSTSSNFGNFPPPPVNPQGANLGELPNTASNSSPNSGFLPPPPLIPSNNLPFNTAQEGEEPKKQQEPVPIYPNGWTAEQIDSKYSQYKSKLLDDATLYCVEEETFYKIRNRSVKEVVALPLDRTKVDIWHPETRKYTTGVCYPFLYLCENPGDKNGKLYQDTEGRKIFLRDELGPKIAVTVLDYFNTTVDISSVRGTANLNEERALATQYIAYLKTAENIFGESYKQHIITYDKFHAPQNYKDAHKLFVQSQ